MARRAISIRTDIYDLLKVHCYDKLDTSMGPFVESAILTALDDPETAARIVDQIRVANEN